MCKYMQYKPLNGREYLYCSITNNICLYSKYCNKQQKFIANERWEQCELMNSQKNIPMGAHEVICARRGYLYVVIDKYTIRIKNTLNKVPEYVYVKETIDGYDISETPFETKRNSTKNKKDKTHI